MSSRYKKNSSKHQTLPARNSIDFEQKAKREYLADDDIDDDEDDEINNEEEDDDEFEDNGGQQFGKEDFEDDIEGDDIENKNKEEDEDEDEDDGENHKHQKKRKLKSLLAVASSYEFAPRVQTPTAETGATKKRIFGARNAVADWSEHETFILLDAWGDKFLKHGRKSLWSEEWREVAKIVSEKSNRTDYQCRNRLDTLKKKYKKEKAKTIQNKRFTSTWMYFKRMDSLMSLPSRRAGVSCGVDDSGEHVVTNTKPANGFDELDNHGISDHEDTEVKGIGNVCSLKSIADSIIKFCHVYEKIEKRKMLQMLELEEMRMKFRTDMELKKMQIFERAWTEIVDTWRRKDEENYDFSDEDTNG